MKHLPRFFVPDISPCFSLSAAQLHHLVRVLRMKTGEQFLVFNQDQGEWLCALTDQEGRRAIRMRRLREFAPRSSTHLAFSMIKPDNVKTIIEKCTELGITHFYPIISEYTQYRNINLEKLSSIAIQAVQQCERIDIPEISSPCTLRQFFDKYSNNISWFAALERRQTGIPRRQERPCGVVIGPEGGWSTEDCAILEAHCIPLSLGPFILRSETAAIAASFFLTSL